jgi:glycosyltransferase involved in cell wall biosynthesis
MHFKPYIPTLLPAERARAHAGGHRGGLLFLLLALLWVVSVSSLWLTQGLLMWSSGLVYVLYDTWLIAYVLLKVRHAPTAQAVAAREQVLEPSHAIAVLIAARNEMHALPATLEALRTQSDPADEIWVIDDGSTDCTRKMLARRYGVVFPGGMQGGYSPQWPALRVVSKPNTGKADSLNLALSHTRAPLIVTLDADTHLERDALRAMRQAFARDASLVACGGVLTPRCAGSTTAPVFQWFQTFEYLRSFISRIAWMQVDALLLVSGAFAVYRLDALEAVGGFDARSWVEDYELIHRLHQYAHEHGHLWHIQVLGAARATTDAPAAVGSFLRQRRRWFAGFLQTLYRYRTLIGDGAYGTLGRLMLPIKVADTLQPLYGITAFVLLVTFAVRQQPILPAVLIVIGIKLVVDCGFLLWGVELYSRWSGQPATRDQRFLALAAALTEPFFFQLVRHTGALLGWFAILTRRVDWQTRRSFS